MSSLHHHDPSTMSSIGTAPTPEPIPIVRRSAVLGIAAGSRSTLGLLAPLLAQPTRSRPALTGAVLATVGELIADKLPTTPSRLQPPSLVARLASAANGARLLGRAEAPQPPRAVATAAAVAIAAAAVGSYAGAAWRKSSSAVLPALPAAVAEDALAIVLATWACRARRPQLA